MKTFNLEIQGSDVVSAQYLRYLVGAALADPTYGAKVSECKLVAISEQEQAPAISNIEEIVANG